MPRIPKNVNKSDPVLAKEYNKVLAELRRLGQLFDAGQAGQAKSLRLDQVWLGIIQDQGPTVSDVDYEDARYWVNRAKIDLDETDNPETELALVQYTASSHYKKAIVTATNLAEVVTGTHSLPMDTPVVVIKFLDEGSPSTARYFFWCTPQAFNLFPVTVTQTGGSAGSEVATCSFSYTATDKLGNELGTDLGPEFDLRTPIGVFTAGGSGMGYFDETGDFVLFSVDEVPSHGSCP